MFRKTAITLLAILGLETSMTSSQAYPGLHQLAVDDHETLRTENVVPADLNITGIRLASNNGTGPASTSNKIVDYAVHIDLYPVLDADWQGRHVYLSNADSLVIDGQSISKEDIIPLPSTCTIRYFKIEPVSKRYGTDAIRNIVWMDSLIGTGPCLETDVSPLQYRPIIPKPIVSEDNALPATGPAQYAVGTMRFRAEVDYQTQTFMTPGKKSLRTNPEAVHRVSMRGNTGNPVIDNAYALANTVYYYGSDDNVVMAFKGSDCTKFCTAAYKLSEYPVDLVGSGNLDQYFLNVSSFRARKKASDAVVVNASQYTPLQPGDIVLAKGVRNHTALLLQDNYPYGISDNDLFLHNSSTQRRPEIGTLVEAFRMDKPKRHSLSYEVYRLPTTQPLASLVATTSGPDINPYSAQ